MKPYEGGVLIVGFFLMWPKLPTQAQKTGHRFSPRRRCTMHDNLDLQVTFARNLLLVKTHPCLLGFMRDLAGS